MANRGLFGVLQCTLEIDTNGGEDMSEKLLRFFLLSEIKTVRLVCKHEGCKAIVEIPLSDLENRFSGGCCAVCKASWGVADQNRPGPREGINWLRILSQTVSELNMETVMVEVEFVLPAKEVCRLA